MPEQHHPELSVIQRTTGLLAHFSSCRLRRTHSTDILTLLVPQTNSKALSEGVRQPKKSCDEFRRKSAHQLLRGSISKGIGKADFLI